MAANRGPKQAKSIRAPDAAPPARAADSDLEWVRGLAEIASANGLAELEVRTARATVILRRGAAGPHAGLPVMHVHPAPPPLAPTLSATTVPPPIAAVPAPSVPPPTVEQEEGALVLVSSPFVGTFYRAPSPEAPYFVEVGQRVKKGQVLCIVEAMKLMNEIEAEADGTIAACLVESAQPVEYGQVLFKIVPA